MNSKRLMAAAMPLLFLAACGGAGSGGDGNGTATAQVAAVAAPAGQVWTDVVAVTPEGGYRMGNPEAPVRLVEFASRTCPACANFEATGAPELKERYVSTGRVSYEFRDYLRNPLDIAGALIATCNGTEPFFALTSQMMQSQNEIMTRAQAIDPATMQRIAGLPPAQQYVGYAEAVGLIDWAKQRGIPEPRARQCLADTARADQLVAANTQATQEYEITGTPTFLVNGEKAAALGWTDLEPLIRNAGG